MEERIIKVGHSPDPDDAFMFYGLAAGKVSLPGVKIEHLLEDIQSLNVRALKAELEVTAISAHAYPYVSDNYWVMRTGASMGEGYGPVLVSTRYRTLAELKGKTVATPGAMTTATLLCHIFAGHLKRIDIPFDEVMSRVKSGEFAAGVLIHEGQLTYQDEGFHKILDFGELWAEKTKGLPLPLGLDVVRKDLGRKLAEAISLALRQSIRYAYEHRDESIPYALKWGRGIDASLGERFVRMYVNERTIDMGEPGRTALDLLYSMASERGLVPKQPPVELI